MRPIFRCASALRRANLAGPLKGQHGTRLVAAAFAVTTLWGGAATWYLVFHDEALARFVSQQSAMQYGYEERIGALRMQLDRAAIEQVTTRDGIAVRLAELAQRQVAMEKRQALISTLAGDALPFPADQPRSEDSPAAVPSAERAPTAAKPVPTSDALELRTRDGEVANEAGRQSLRATAQTVASLEQRLDRLAGDQLRSLDAFGLRATRGALRLRAVVARVGLDPSRFDRGRGREGGLGGPLVPIAADPFGIALAQVQRSRDDEERLRRITASIPLRRPLLGDYSLSSSFGPRLDPFTRGLAMHTGLDMKAEYGEAARATAAGRVSVADYAGGYGNMVEIDHGNGLATRYAHLAVFSVMPGQWVEAGGIVGRVGSTGRSTGSHLHYETRIDGEPVDPQRFLRAGNGFDVSAPAGP